ncbi:MAG: glycosyltransferase family 4 protein [Candidatus Omnitrophota bacterium]
MKINILTTAGRMPSGTHRMLFEYANHLVLRSHQVTLIKSLGEKSWRMPKGLRERIYRQSKKGLKRLAHRISGPEVRDYRVPWFHSKAEFIIVPSLAEKYLPDADILLFSTPLPVSVLTRIPDRKGRPVMRVSDVVSSSSFIAHLPVEIPLIAISSLDKSLLSERFPERKFFVCVNGVNTNFFSYPERIFKPAEVIGMLFRQGRRTYRGMDDGVAALQLIHRKYPHLKFRSAGFRREEWLPDFIEFRNVSRTHFYPRLFQEEWLPDVDFIEFWNEYEQRRLVDFYCSLDICLFPSRIESCPNPPMEALACKCALVSTEVGGIDDFTVPGKTALVVPPGRPELLAEKVITLIENPLMLKEIALAGYQKIQDFSLEKQAAVLEEILKGLSNP